MVSMSTFASSRKSTNNHIGFEFTNGVHHIGQYAVLVPKSKCFIRIFRKTKIIGTRKKLFGPICSARS